MIAPLSQHASLTPIRFFVAPLGACPVEVSARARTRFLIRLRGPVSWILGVSRQSVNAIETGRFDPSLPLAFKLSKVFQLPIETIFFR